MGRQRLGVDLMSLIATLREEERLPVRTIQSHLWTVYQLKMSTGAIVEATHRVAQPARPAVADMPERIRGSPVVHADETGWREGGVNGYVRTFSTPRERYFLRRGRGKAVVDEALGESFSGVLTSDFYAAYDHYPGPKQRCWVHLLRDIRALNARSPDDAGLARWSRALMRLYLKAKSRAAHAPERGDRGLTSPDRVKPEEQLLALCRPFLSDKTAPQAKLCRRIERSIENCSSSCRTRTCRPITTRLNGASDTWSSVARSAGDSFTTGHGEQDDPGIPLWSMAGKGPQSSRRMPQSPPFPSTLNSYFGGDARLMPIPRPSCAIDLRN